VRGTEIPAWRTTHLLLVQSLMILLLSVNRLSDLVTAAIKLH